MVRVIGYLMEIEIWHLAQNPANNTNCLSVVSQICTNIFCNLLDNNEKLSPVRMKNEPNLSQLLS